MFALVLFAALARQDGYDTPTETHVELVEGLWHDDALTPEHGWNHYAFTAPATGYVAVQMHSRDPKLWSYLRVIDGSHNWAAVANRKTNVSEVIFHVESGHKFDIIATSQANATLAAGARQTTEGRYTIGVVPIELP